jgi:dTDP-glucose 4,6-dehydratase
MNALEGQIRCRLRDSGSVRDWLHVDDHCAGILRVLRTGRPGEKYNIGGGSERSNLQVVDLICDALEERRPAASNPALAGQQMTSYHALKQFVPDRPGHDRRYAIDATKIGKELGWKPRHTFEAGLRETVGWYLEHRDWCEAIQKGRYDRGRLGLGS